MRTTRHPTKKNPRRPGPQRGEVADRPRKADPNFKQSRDLREDRGERQIKFGHSEHTFQPGRPGSK